MGKGTWILLIFVLSIACRAEEPQQGSPLRAGIIEKSLIFDSRTDTSLGNAPGVVWQASLYSMGSRNFFIGIKDLRASSQDFRILVWNESGPKPATTPEYVIQGSDTAASDEIWIPLMNSSGAVLQLESLSAVMPKIQFTYAYTAIKPVGESYSFRDPPSFVDVSTLKNAALSQASQSVALIYWVENGNLRVCSGFMVDQRHLLSNHHCVATANQCKSARIIFDYRARPAVATQKPRWFPCKSVIQDNSLKERDLAVLELRIPASEKPPPGLDFASGVLLPNQSLAIIQHPLGQPQQAVLNGCSNMKAPTRSPLTTRLVDMAHQCDTADGSSGAPVLDIEGKVRAVHHWGYVKADPEFKDLNRAILIDEVVLQTIRALPE